MLAFVATISLSASAIAPPAKIAVVGATGKVGRSAVQQLVQRGYVPRILLRHTIEEGTLDTSEPLADDASPAAVATYLASLPGVETVSGDVTDRASCDALLSGCTAVLALHGARRTRQLSDLWRNPEGDANHAKQINYQGVANLIDAARASGTCKRIVRLTGKGETPWSIFSILINGLGSMAKAWNVRRGTRSEGALPAPRTRARGGYAATAFRCADSMRVSACFEIATTWSTRSSGRA